MRKLLLLLLTCSFLAGYSQKGNKPDNDFCITFSSGRTLCFKIKSYNTVAIAQSNKVSNYTDYTGWDDFLGIYTTRHNEYKYTFEGSLVIPKSVNDQGTTYIVNQVGNLDHTKLTSIKLPETVTIIAPYAFAFSSLLSQINLPNSITTIGEGAFKGCTRLTQIILPNQLNSIARATFENSGLVSVIIPSSVKTIETEAFKDCKNLKEVTIQKGVKKIGYDAFRGCCNLKELVIPEGVEEIGDDAFNGCTRLRILKLPNSLKQIDEKNILFRGSLWDGGLPSLEKIIIPAGSIERFKKYIISEYIDKLVEEASVVAPVEVAPATIIRSKDMESASFNSPVLNSFYEYLTYRNSFSQSNDYYWNNFALCDITGDGIPELWIETGTCEADHILLGYRYINNSVKKFYEGTAFHSGFAYGKGYFIRYTSWMGYEETYKMAFNPITNSIIETLIYAAEIDLDENETVKTNKINENQPTDTYGFIEFSPFTDAKKYFTDLDKKGLYR